MKEELVVTLINKAELGNWEGSFLPLIKCEVYECSKKELISLHIFWQIIY